MDRFAAGLFTLLEERNATDLVDVVFVSDHGMTGEYGARMQCSISLYQTQPDAFLNSSYSQRAISVLRRHPRSRGIRWNLEERR